jgi:hypothetical protein
MLLPPLIPLAQRDTLLHQSPSDVDKIEKLCGKLQIKVEQTVW